MVDFEFIAALRKRYFEISSAIWLWLDNVLNAYSINNREIFNKNGLTNEQVDQLWLGIEANLPIGITKDDAKAIIDPNDLQNLRVLAPLQYKGTNLKAHLLELKKPSSGHYVHQNHSK